MVELGSDARCSALVPADQATLLGGSHGHGFLSAAEMPLDRACIGPVSILVVNDLVKLVSIRAL